MNNFSLIKVIFQVLAFVLVLNIIQGGGATQLLWALNQVEQTLSQATLLTQ